MTAVTGDSRSVILSVRIFRMLSKAYPTKFRAEYEASMVQVFRDACRRAVREGGLSALLGLWVRTILDLAITVIEEHARGGTNMTREKFYQLSGWALMAGPFLFLIGWLAGTRPEYNPYNAAALPVDRIANLAAMPLAAAGLLFISLGMVGLLLRYGSKAGIASVWLGLGIFGALSSAVGAVWMTVDNESYGWIFFFVGLFIQFLALSLFGLANLRLRLLPRWNLLPLIAGIWIPGYLVFTGLVQFAIGSWIISGETLFNYLWALSFVMFAGLGYLLHSEPKSLSAKST